MFRAGILLSQREGCRTGSSFLPFSPWGFSGTWSVVHHHQGGQELGPSEQVPMTQKPIRSAGVWGHPPPHPPTPVRFPIAQ